MKIRLKIFLVVLPLIILTLILAQTASFFSATLGVTRLAQQFLSFKMGGLENFAENQWTLLVENGFAGRPDMVEAAKRAVETYAASILLSDTEIIFAVDTGGNIAMSSPPFEISEAELAALLALLEAENPGLQSAAIGGHVRTFQSAFFTPFQWHLIISEKSEVFYQDANSIRMQTIITLIVSIIITVILLIVLTGHLTRPLDKVVKTMDKIITSADLTSRVDVEYQDETGNLAFTFNRMLEELDKAYRQIKKYAFESALAGKKEERIRQIFQKYVPNDVIERFFASPEKMLVGENRKLAVLFSDIRSFTTISETMAPDDLVNSLNRYFSTQVETIYSRKGVVDKYIGDAIMAFWGAPTRHEDDALQSVLSALDMLDGAAKFNENQKKLGKSPFYIGIGINYGEVTVGNIGSDRKMDYTVIGDAVNLASRMEGLTKTYHCDLLISEFLYLELKKTPPSAAAAAAASPLYFRLIDTVTVKGKTQGVKVYTVKRALSAGEKNLWTLHGQGMELYYRRDFSGAAQKFKEASSLMPEDFNAKNMHERCLAYSANPPPENWDGAEVMTSK
ncbi:MAG: adenylate/guanylate cyclase domain-containing protein [Spirochaetes bacterium]|nr:adenylate/guanylate cyclase domain-containing protein [Spirochaetota bacterium]